jgi:hypothetical protein
MGCSLGLKRWRNHELSFYINILKALERVDNEKVFFSFCRGLVYWHD